MVFCSKCGKSNSDSFNSCTYCGSPLMKSEYYNINSFNTFEELFVDKNLNILLSVPLNEEEYKMILKNIINLGDYNLKELFEEVPSYKKDNFDILTKISFITTAFAKINYKSRGAELGSYAFNEINIDDRLDNSNQISALIHELAHHLLAEIIEQILMYVFEVKKSDVLESYVLFALSILSSKLLNEYCAHTVQGRFIPHGYQNYGSFNNLLTNEFDPEEDGEIVVINLLLGNSFAEDIIKILEHFIDYDLREEIKTQFKKDYNYPPKYDEILLEKKESFDFETKINLLFSLLKETFELAKEKESKELLYYLNEQYSEFNKY